MRRCISPLASVLALALNGSTLHAQAPTHMQAQSQAPAASVALRQSVYTLARLQDKLAAGDAQALHDQGLLIAQIEADLRHYSKDQLSKTANLQALALLLTSGGNPNVLGSFIDDLPNDHPYRPLLLGLRAYARADRGMALAFLKPIRAGQFPTALYGRILLLRATLTAQAEPGAALVDLDILRSLLPGTFVEESALRRCLPIAVEARARATFYQCAKRYTRSFNRSLYWGEFTKAYAAGVARLASSASAEDASPILSSVTGLGAAQSQELLLDIVQSCLRFGHFALADEVLKHFKPGASDKRFAVRISLYKAATDLAFKRIDQAVQNLAQVARPQLGHWDQAFYDDLQSLTLAITTDPVATAEMTAATLIPIVQTAGADLTQAVVNATQTQLAKSQKVLK